MPIVGGLDIHQKADHLRLPRHRDRARAARPGQPGRPGAPAGLAGAVRPSRWAGALREFASRNGELPAEEGYPAGLSSALAAFYERAGRVVTSGGLQGSVTIIGAVSPAGGDMTEPVTVYTQRFLRSLWPLDRDPAPARP